MDSILEQLVELIKAETIKCNIMEVCGTHTMAIAKSGIRGILPPNIRLLSGPGCPVCVTSQGDLDAIISLSEQTDITLVTFGDMLRVPGSHGSLQEARSRGADVKVVYSPLETLEIARQRPDRQVIFLGIGFETTAPAVAVTVQRAHQLGLKNLSVYSLHKLVPPALQAIFADPELQVDGLICPGHVTVVIGMEPYENLAAHYHKPMVVTGFEAEDILEGIGMLIRQLKTGTAKAELQYKRVVRAQGNLAARQVLEQVFTPVDAAWRGLGIIPDSGLDLKPQYASYNARERFHIEPGNIDEIPGCSCGAILSGKLEPEQCPLFGKVCTPTEPVGPCMVSQEGACAAFYRYQPLRRAQL
ncbi:MAG TPA: hydrogenase formation protein HypD [Syntrophomonadaceae bacterium]|nr:hydrogenase formation protein HypD [Syntrophomonadaceae bacterium]HQE23083.1 hydrogenase formation protein HypD [Syntrophomonadaceae bacterium]